MQLDWEALEVGRSGLGEPWGEDSLGPLGQGCRQWGVWAGVGDREGPRCGEEL